MEDKNKTKKTKISKIIFSPELQKAIDQFNKSIVSQKVIDQFNKSIEDARASGVPEDKILKTKEEVDKYFL